LLAINAANDCRKISPINFLREDRLFKNASCIGKMYFAHVFDHPNRIERQVDSGMPIWDSSNARSESSSGCLAVNRET
jgi:hypothetical protein